MSEQQTSTDKRLRNLKPQWQPGQSGNPNGRPPNKDSITWWYKQLLAENEGISAYEVARKAIEKAKEGSLPHTQEITDRTDGKVPSDVNVRALIIHVGDDYARQGLEALKQKMLERENRLTEAVENGQL